MLDFYGTVVHEDDVIITKICSLISHSSPGQPPPTDIASYWWTSFTSACRRSHGDGFRTQRTLEHASLLDTIDHFDSGCDPDELSDKMYEHWQRPPVFKDALEFLSRLRLPVVVISNIDRRDIEAAIAHHGLRFDGLVTSEDVRSYKPRPELFEAGMALLGTREVLHVGDSPSSDVVGASALGVAVAWVDRKGSALAEGVHPDHRVRNLTELLQFLGD